MTFPFISKPVLATLPFFAAARVKTDLFFARLSLTLTLGIAVGISFQAKAKVQFNSTHGSYFSTAAQYMVPNEEFPQRALSIWKTAPRGAYVSFGTERGNLGASNSPEITDLFQIDFANGIVNYNQVNRLIFKMSHRNRLDYRFLRLNASWPDWRARMIEKNFSSEEIRFMQMSFLTWATKVRSAEFKNFHSNRRHPFAKFQGVNYLEEDEPFYRLKDLIDTNHVFVGQLDFNDVDAVEEFVQHMEERGLSLSVLDISNAWWSSFIKPANLAAVLEKFNRVATEESLLLLTGQNTPIMVAHGPYDRTFYPFFYQAHTFAKIRQYKTFRRFVSGIKWNSMTQLTLNSSLNPVTSDLHRCGLLLLGL